MDDLSAVFETRNEYANSEIATTSSYTPIIYVPTTLSAAEYSDIAGATNDSTHYKHVFSAPSPSLVILDPQLAASTTPASIWLSTGMRAVDHCIETFCASKGITEPSDSLALKGLGNLVPGLLRCARDGDGKGLDARLSCQLGSVDAMAACSSTGVEMGASHGIGHQLGPLGVGHGDTSCILLPAVCLPRSLSEVGVSQYQLDELELAANSLRDRWCATNPVPLVHKKQVLEILNMVI
ncbi:hypothetical protein PMG11_06015 [Penicillium brasilianum]|uniref:Fe-containing alcohol dehydrogenase-like C-terminal domain-containing protein n=1 Tax=Penicillium brasilianum TaxID=104259 RepID=A0A0F7TKL3_PENBI|nr:hypothetical protein PMG11_06015 [Penicillium brasilianum]